jgi:hypothetical protein
MLTHDTLEPCAACLIAQFFIRMQSEIVASLEKSIDPSLTSDVFVVLSRQIFGQACVSFAQTAQMDSSPRFVEVISPLNADVLGFLDNYTDGDASVMQHRTFDGMRSSQGCWLRRSRRTPSFSTSVWGAAHRWGSLETETGMTRLALSDDDAMVCH